MSISLLFGDLRGEYGYMSNSYPAPFILDKERWRTVDHYFYAMRTSDNNVRDNIKNAPSALLARDIANNAPIRTDWETRIDTDNSSLISGRLGVEYITVRDMVMLNAVSAKFRNNPHIANKLKNTSPIPLTFKGNDPYWGGQKNMLGKLLMYVRDYSIKTDTSGNNDMGIIFDNLYELLHNQGYNRITSINNTPVDIPLSEMPRTDTKGIAIEGMSILDETVDEEDDEGNIRKRRTGKKKNIKIRGIVDIYIDSQYTEERLKDVIGPEIDRGKRSDMTYFVITMLTPKTLNKFLRLATYNNIRFFSPSELYITPSKHMLSPYVEKVYADADIYQFLYKRISKLPEISSTDKLIKELGFVPGDIIRVDDFSPHYRVVV